MSLHTVALIARVYTADSLSYTKEADFWLDYYLKLAYDVEGD
jgi:hypothetical protein